MRSPRNLCAQGEGASPVSRTPQTTCSAHLSPCETCPRSSAECRPLPDDERCRARRAAALKGVSPWPGWTAVLLLLEMPPAHSTPFLLPEGQAERKEPELRSQSMRRAQLSQPPADQPVLSPSSRPLVSASFSVKCRQCED